MEHSVVAKAATPVRADRRRVLLAAGVFLVFALVELWTPVVHGGWYFPGDDGQYWTLTKVGISPPQNGLTGDVYEGLVPFLGTDVAALRAGHLPTWNPANGNGQPFLANGQSAVLSPFTLLYAVVGLHVGLVIAALAKLWMLGFFTYLVLRRRGLHDIAAAIGGVVFAYAGYHLVWLQFQDIVSVSAFLPVALWCADVAVTGTASRRAIRTWAAVGLALAIGAMGLSGHPETLLFDGLLVAAYALFLVGHSRPGWRRAARRLVPVAVAGAAGVALAAVQLVPFWQYESHSARAETTHGSARQVIPGFPLDTLSMVAFPDLFGGPQYGYDDPALYQHHERSNYAEVNGTALGLPALCLAGVGVVALGARRRRRRDATAAMGLFLLGAVLVDGLLLFSGPVGTLWWHLPGVGTAVLNRSQDVVLFGMAGLAGVGVDWLARAAPVERRRRAAAAALTFVVVGAATTFGALALRRSLLGSTAGKTGASLVRTDVVTELALAAATALVLVLVALGVSRMLRVAAGTGAVVLGFAGNGLPMRSFNPSVATSQVYPVTRALAAVRATVGNEETLFDAASFPWADVNLRYGLVDVGSFDPLDFAWQADLYRRTFGTTSAGETERLPSCLGGLQLFGVQWVVGGTGRLADGTSLPRVVGGRVPVYRVPDSGPVAVVTGSVTSGDGAATAALASCRLDPTTTAVLASGAAYPAPGSAGVAVAATPVDSASAILITHSATEQQLRVASPSAAWLVIRQTWAPGWSATLDGRSVALRRADVAFDAVAVPPGTHDVVLSYRPPGLSIGVAVSGVAAAAMLGAAVSAGIVERRRRQAQPAGAGADRRTSW
jgi:hypothetical protein